MLYEESSSQRRRDEMTPNSSHVTQQKYIYTGDDENLYGKAFYSQASASAKL